MPAVPTVRSDHHPTTQWVCQHCQNQWTGKPKHARTSSGNPTCSECGRRSGTTETDNTDLQSQEENTESNSPLSADAILAAVVIEGVKWTYTRSRSPSDQVM